MSAFRYILHTAAPWRSRRPQPCARRRRGGLPPRRTLRVWHSPKTQHESYANSHMQRLGRALTAVRKIHERWLAVRLSAPAVPVRDQTTSLNNMHVPPWLMPMPRAQTL